MEFEWPLKSDGFDGIRGLREKVHFFLNRPLASIEGLADFEVIRDVTPCEFRKLMCEELEIRYLELHFGTLMIKRLPSNWHAGAQAGFHAAIRDTVVTAGTWTRIANKGTAYIPCSSGYREPDALYGCRDRAVPEDFDYLYSTASLIFEVDCGHLTLEKLKENFRDYLSLAYPVNIVIGVKMDFVQGQNPGPNTICTVLYTDRHIFLRIVERETAMGHPVLAGPVTGFPEFPVVNLPLNLLYSGVPNPPTTPHPFDLQQMVVQIYRSFR